MSHTKLTNKRFSAICFFLSTIWIATAQTTLKGKISDYTTNRPIPFTTVKLWEAAIGAVADEKGNYVIDGLKPGIIRLEVSFVGYERKVTEEINLRPGINYFNIQLQQTSQTLSEVKVQANTFRKPEETPLSFRRIGISEIERSPGGNRDISRVIQAFPGVGSTVSFRNDLIVRGGGPSENSFYVDGIEIPNLNHFATQGASGGPVGIINADLIREAEFTSGSFPVNRGDGLSALLDLKLIDGNQEERKYKATLGASEVSLSTDGPIGKKTTYLASARRSYLQLLFGAIGLPFLPTFNDVTIKTKTRIDEKNELTVIGIGAFDVLTLNKDAGDTPDKKYILGYLPYNDQWNYTVGAVYKHYVKNGFQTLALSRNHLNNKIYKYLNNDESSKANLNYDLVSDEVETKIRYEHAMRLNRYKFVYGAGMEQSTFNNSVYQQLFVNNQKLIIDNTSSLGFFRYHSFAQFSGQSNNARLNLSLGIRVDGNTYSADMSNPLNQISPRLSGSYQISDRWAFNFGSGIYFQLPAYTTLGYRDENKTLINKANHISYIQSQQLSAGLEFNPVNHAKFTIEGFYKNYANYPLSLRDSVSMASKGGDYGVFGDEPVASSSKGRALGLEMLARWTGHKGLNFIASYTYVRSEFDNGNGIYLPSAWDNRHLFTLTGSQTLPKNWLIGLRWRFVGGAPYTPYNEELSSNIEAYDLKGQAYLDYSKFNSLRLKNFHQLDVRVDKYYYFSGWMLGMYLDLQNAYNFKYQGQPFLAKKLDSNGSPVLKDATHYELEQLKNESGTLLPSIGLMIEF